MTLEHIRPLTQEERQTAKEAAKEAVRRGTVAQLANRHLHRGTGRVNTQSRLGGTPTGLSAGLDGFAGFPARPGEPQFDYEPPRVTSRTDNRAARLKALGNAVVPQVVLPLAEAIYEYLVELAANEAA